MLPIQCVTRYLKREIIFLPLIGIKVIYFIALCVQHYSSKCYIYKYDKSLQILFEYNGEFILDFLDQM